MLDAITAKDRHRAQEASNEEARELDHLQRSNVFDGDRPRDEQLTADNSGGGQEDAGPGRTHR
jgi:hypothetical protein